jgi:endonuclease/exonuclease/phosphatase family metal-dependent hydrolase
MRLTGGASRIILTGLFCAGLGCASLAGTGSKEVRVLVYNIHAGWSPSGQSNLERVAAVIRELQADVVLLQEVDRNTTRSGNVDQIARLSELTGLHAAFGKTLPYQGGDYGIAILSRWPIASDTLIRLPVEPPQQRAGGLYEPRGALYTVLARPGGELHVVNTHIDASREDHYRRQEIRTVAEIGARGRARARTLVGGDLNAEPGTDVVNNILAQSWRDAFALCGTGEGLTYPWDIPVKRIDYLLLSDGWRCREARVVENDASDHRPVFVRLEAIPMR